MKLFHAWLSSASRRVRLCLAEKDMAYESVPVDLSRQEQHSPAFLAMNPNGVVPALEVAPGHFLYESATICEYLDDIQEHPRLRPVDPFVRAQMRNFVRWTDEQVLPHLLILNWSLMLQPAAQSWSNEELQERLQRIPTAERRQAWERIARKPYTAEEKDHALEKLLVLIDKMEAMLTVSSSPWLFSEGYSLADIAAAPFVARIAEIKSDAITPQRTPGVEGWWARIRQRPAFAVARLELFSEAVKSRQREK